MNQAEEFHREVENMTPEDFKCKVWSGGQNMLYLTYNFDSKNISKIVFKDGSTWKS